MGHYRIGLDIGSTTVKTVVLNETGQICYSKYERHNAHVPETLGTILDELNTNFPNTPFSLTITGSVGLGIAERSNIHFTQEVVALTTYVKHFYPQTSTLIDIGGEDAKIVFLNEKQTPDMRMNGNCAGGTGAFIDQMAVLLNTTTEGLDKLAQNAKHTHPIASRCGVFAKTDIQNLIAKTPNEKTLQHRFFMPLPYKPS